MDKVSIILPVFNCEKYLKHTIVSVQKQNYKNWELLIVDDASTDNSLSEALKFAENDSRIQVFQMPQNVGVGACRNVAMKHATGRYLAFIDSDDLWAKEKLSRQIVFMRKHKAALSHTAYAYMNAKGELLQNGQNNVDEKIDMRQYMKTSQIGMSTVMIDREKTGSFMFPEDRELCEDAKLWMSFMRRGMFFYGLNQVLMLYRVREHQLSRRKDKMATNTFRRYMKEDTLDKFERLYYFTRYACNAIKKRKCKRSVSAQFVQEQFNCRQAR